ncbi:MAG: DUF3108 domain-containing protein [Hydrogenophaga sp.]|nr:DUF3108 domain-containing protein [Hydrogenophaga sp.]
MQHPPPVPGTPRWPQLVLLGTVVAGVHLGLLVGEWPLSASDAVPPSAAALSKNPNPSTTSPSADPASAPQPAPVRPVTVSTVRWVIAPPAAVPLVPAADTPAEPPRPARPSPAPPAETPSATPLEAPAPQPAEAIAAPHVNAVEPTPPMPEPPPEDGLEVAQAAAPAEPATPAEGAVAPRAASAPPADAAPLPPARPPASAALTYDVAGSVRGISYNAQATLDWTLEAGRYDARMAVRLPLVGSRVQTSAGQVGATGLLPERFADKARSERAAHFDHAQQRIRFSANTPDAELQPGAQDRLSVFLQLAARLNAAPERLQTGQLIELQVAGTTDAEPWRFRVGEEETLPLPAGALRTRQLVREPRQPRDSQVELWLAPDLQHLPVRIRIVQHNGDQLDQQLSRLP